VLEYVLGRFCIVLCNEWFTLLVWSWHAGSAVDAALSAGRSDHRCLGLVLCIFSQQQAMR